MEVELHGVTSFSGRTWGMKAIFRSRHALKHLPRR
jgi:hypothetical protein